MHFLLGVVSAWKNLQSGVIKYLSTLSLVLQELGSGYTAGEAGIAAAAGAISPELERDATENDPLAVQCRMLDREKSWGYIGDD